MNDAFHIFMGIQGIPIEGPYFGLDPNLYFLNHDYVVQQQVGRQRVAVMPDGVGGATGVHRLFGWHQPAERIETNTGHVASEVTIRYFCI